MRDQHNRENALTVTSRHSTTSEWPQLVPRPQSLQLHTLLINPVLI